MTSHAAQPIAAPQHGHPQPSGHGNSHANGLEDKLHEFDERYEQTKNFLTKLSIESARIYVEAADKFLKDTDGNYDYTKIENTPFAQFIGEKYGSLAEQFYNLPSGTNWNEIQRAAAMKGIFGMNSAEMTHSIRNAGERYTTDAHMGEHGIYAAITKSVKQTLYPTTTKDFIKDDIEGIMDHIGLKNKINIPLMPIEEATQLLLSYKVNGVVGLNQVDKKYHATNSAAQPHHH